MHSERRKKSIPDHVTHSIEIHLSSSLGNNRRSHHVKSARAIDNIKTAKSGRFPDDFSSVTGTYFSKPDRIDVGIVG